VVSSSPLSLLTWVILPIGAWYVSLIWASAFTSVVRWAHVQYSLGRSGSRLGGTTPYPWPMTVKV
jgi:hypothetical protein